jgi:hypothetical protein
VVAAAEKILLSPDVIGAVQAFHFANSYVLSFDTAVLSNVISNVRRFWRSSLSYWALPISIAFGW